MIREAKGVAIHDLSFWAQTLPLLDGLARVIRDYQFHFWLGIDLAIESEIGLALHDRTLAHFVRLARGDQLPPGNDDIVAGDLGGRMPDQEDIVESYSGFLAQGLYKLFESRPAFGTPQINLPVPGCGLVTGGACDLMWSPYLLELKLTAKEPGVRDIRQLLMYAALMHISALNVPPIALIANPRLGIAVELEFSELLLMTGGLTLDECSALLSDFLVREDVS